MRIAALLVASLLVSPLALADKTYQKTGKVVETNDKTIVIATDKEGNWEFKRDAGTKVEGAVKKGDRVTVYYSMSASRIESKAAKK